MQNMTPAAMLDLHGWGSATVSTLVSAGPHPFTMASPDSRRPAWLQWLILLTFLWSSWQLAGFWLARLHG